MMKIKFNKDLKIYLNRKLFVFDANSVEEINDLDAQRIIKGGFAERIDSEEKAIEETDNKAIKKAPANKAFSKNKRK